MLPKWPEMTYETITAAAGFQAGTLGEVLKGIYYEGFIN